MTFREYHSVGEWMTCGAVWFFYARQQYCTILYWNGWTYHWTFFSLSPHSSPVVLVLGIVNSAAQLGQYCPLLFWHFFKFGIFRDHLALGFSIAKVLLRLKWILIQLIWFARMERRNWTKVVQNIYLTVFWLVFPHHLKKQTAYINTNISSPMHLPWNSWKSLVFSSSQWKTNLSWKPCNCVKMGET